MSYLASNLSVLASVLGHSPRLPDDDVRVRLDRTGPAPVLLLGTADSAIALNSRRDPLAEASKLLETSLAGRPAPSAIAAIGLGLGYIIDAAERVHPSARVLALEPEPACVRHLLERRDLTSLLTSGRLRLLWGPDYLGAADAWRLLEGTDESRATVVHPALSRLLPAETAAALKQVERMVFGARSNAEARRKFAGRYLLNTLRNLPAIAGSADVRSVFGSCRGLPGVVVSAGPSLDDSLVELSEIVDRAVIISVDTALRPLLANGIHPHLVVAVDPSEANGRHLTKLPSLKGTWLVAEGSIAPEAFDAFRERVLTFRVSDHEPWPWLRELGLERGQLRAWGSVATSGFDLALKLGCDPICFVGQDLAYTGGRPYCRGTTYEEDWAAAVQAGLALPALWRKHVDASGAFAVEDLAGRPTQTTEALVAFRDWLVQQCASERGGRRFVNASRAGIFVGPGIEQGRLSEVLHGRDPLPAGLLAGRENESDAAGVKTNLLRSLERLLGQDDRRCHPWTEWEAFSANTADSRTIAAALKSARLSLRGEDRPPGHERENLTLEKLRDAGALTEHTGRTLRYLKANVRHYLPSFLLSLDDSPHGPTSELLDLSLAAVKRASTIDLTDVARLFSGDKARYINCWPGEQYKLLAGFMEVLKPRLVIEVGTAAGGSCLTMKKFLPAESRLVTYDIVPWDAYPQTGLKPSDFDGRLEQRVTDLSDPNQSRKEATLLEQADFIFLDAAKDGAMEYRLWRFLEELTFARPPIVFLDDIRFVSMIELWREIRHPKLDLTSFGHWSGTGVVQWR